MTDLYMVTLAYKAHSGALQLQFSSAEGASDAHTQIKGAMDRSTLCDVEDGYGTKVHVDGRDVATVTMQHLNRLMDGQRAAQILQAKANVKTQKEAAQDPDLRQPTVQVPGRPPFMGGPQG